MCKSQGRLNAKQHSGRSDSVPHAQDTAAGRDPEPNENNLVAGSDPERHVPDVKPNQVNMKNVDDQLIKTARPLQPGDTFSDTDFPP